jgi:hypothetical protein
VLPLLVSELLPLHLPLLVFLVVNWAFAFELRAGEFWLLIFRGIGLSVSPVVLWPVHVAVMVLFLAPCQGIRAFLVLLLSVFLARFFLLPFCYVSVNDDLPLNFCLFRLDLRLQLPVVHPYRSFSVRTSLLGRVCIEEVAKWLDPRFLFQDRDGCGSVCSSYFP